MTVERYKWNCPACGLAFGIKKGTPPPGLCPECAKKPQPASPPEAIHPTHETQENTVEITIPDLPEAEEEPNFLQGLSSSETSSSANIKTVSRRSSRGRYSSFRKLSTFYQILAFLILVGSGIGTIFAITKELNYWYTGSIFAAGIIFSLILAGLGVILRVVIDIEANTRDR